LKRILNFLIILYILFIFVNPSTGIKLKDDSSNINLDEIDNLKELLSGKIAYAWTFSLGPHGEGPCYFNLNNPSDIIQLSTTLGPYFPSGGTWTNDGRWLVCEYYQGRLWEINPETGDWTEFGVAGVSLNGLAYNPVNNKLYGAASFNLYEIDVNTGEQTYIGDFGNGPDTMIGIAFDAEGILYGWDIGNDSLWTIDIETGEATLVGPLGIDLHYLQDGHFKMEDDILYLAACTSGPYNGALYMCNEDTGECTFAGQFEGNAQLTAFAIPYGNDTDPPKTNIYFNPPAPDGDNGWYARTVGVKLNATDDSSGVNRINYKINGENWRTNNGNNVTFFLRNNDDNIEIQYYAIDNAGNIEDVKSANIKIDKTPPNIVFCYLPYKKLGKWYIKYIANCNDDTSGMDRVELYINKILVDTDKEEPYEWTFQWSDIINFLNIYVIAFDKAGNSVGKNYPHIAPKRSVKGFIYNSEINEKNITIFPILIVKTSYYEFGFDSYKVSRRLYVFKKLTIPNDYTGYIGKHFMIANYYDW
jgi:hypothetical protein